MQHELKENNQFKLIKEEVGKSLPDIDLNQSYPDLVHELFPLDSA